MLPNDDSFPLLQQLLSGANASGLSEELSRLIQLRTAGPFPRATPARARRLRKNLFARLRSLDGSQQEVGVVLDISSTGIRVRFLRGSSLDVIKDNVVIIETRLPSKDMVSLEARMVRVAHTTDQHIELAFHFEPDVPERSEFRRLLRAIEAG